MTKQTMDGAQAFELKQALHIAVLGALMGAWTAGVSRGIQPASDAWLDALNSCR